jgi:hypothetical protein
MQPSNSLDDVIALDGPDYVALVIEWNDEDDAVTLPNREIVPEPARRISTPRTIAAVVGALGALVLAAWGLRRLRAA